MRPYVTAAVALTGASVIAVSPVEPPPPREIHITSSELRLAAASSVLNIPINLIKDIINIPYNAVQGINSLGQSLLFSGTWLLASSTNVWGTDPGDPGHYYGLANLLFPFPAFSNAVGAQITGVAAVLFPIHSGCNNFGCPNGSALVAGWYQLDRIRTLLTTGKYTFDDTPVTYPDGTIRPPEGLWNSGGAVTWGAQYNHPEWDTKTDPATGMPVVPWAGTTFTFKPLSPFSDYLTHLMSDPTSDENAIKFATAEQSVTAFWNLVQGAFVAFFDKFPGSPWCLGLCGKTYGPDSLLAPPFFYDPPPAAPPPGFEWLSPFLGPETTTASPNQKTAPVGANAVSTPQGSGAQQSEATQNEVVNLSTEGQQVVQSITPAVTEAPADAAAVPNTEDSKANQILATDTTRDGNMTVPGKVGGNGTNSRGGVSRALRSVGDQISATISKVTGGLTDGAKTGETSTGDTEAGEAGTGGRHRAE